MSNQARNPAAGGCLCGAVRFRITGPLRDVVVCHCDMCRKQHGAAGFYSKAKKAHIDLMESRGLKWYRSSATVRRGFCGECGAGLFWEPDGQDTTSVLAGALDPPTCLRTVGHIFAGDKADFHEITDGLPQFEGFPDGTPPGDGF